MNDSKQAAWLENGLLVLVLVAGLLAPMRRPQRHRPSMMTALAPWAGIAVTLAAFVLHATWNAAKVDSAIAAQNAGLSAQNNRIDQLVAQEAAEAQRMREFEDRILFLCNERRRDNEESGRVTNSSPC